MSSGVSATLSPHWINAILSWYHATSCHPESVPPWVSANLSQCQPEPVPTWVMTPWVSANLSQCHHESVPMSQCNLTQYHTHPVLYWIKTTWCQAEGEPCWVSVVSKQHWFELRSASHKIIATESCVTLTQSHIDSCWVSDTLSQWCTESVKHCVCEALSQFPMESRPH